MSSSSRLAPFLAKFEARKLLSQTARSAFLALPIQVQEIAANTTFVFEGDRTRRSCFLERGFVSRNKSLREGQRQIVSFHLPGDMVDLQSVLVILADHSLHAHVRSTLLTVAHSDLLAVAAEFPDLGRALWFDTLVDAAIFREWTLNVGRRTAAQATAHLLLELHHKFSAIGLAENGSFELPISQIELADALGLSPVHTNRSLQALRGKRLIRTFRQTVTIEDMDAMIELAEFDPLYMHPEGPRQPGEEAPD